MPEHLHFLIGYNVNQLIPGKNITKNLILLRNIKHQFSNSPSDITLTVLFMVFSEI